MNSFDVVIVGAGSAGLMSAQLIAKEGYKVALVERKNDLLDLPFSTLGSFMDIKKYGLSNKVIASMITSGDFHSRSVSFSKKTNNTNILYKSRIHSELLEKCNSYGVKIFSGGSIEKVDFDKDGSITSLSSNSGEIFKGEIYLDCSGTTGILSKKAGLQDKQFKIGVGVEYEVRYTGDPHKAIFFIGSAISGGYGWIFPLGNQRAIAGFGSMDQDVIKNIKEAFLLMLKDKHIRNHITIDKNKMHGGTLPITDVKTKFVKNNLVCVGDSVSQVNPTVGEGYVFILDAALIASKAVIKSLKQENLELLHEYEENWLDEYGNDYKYSKLLQRILVRATSNDFTSDLGLLFLKYKRSSTINRLLSGRFGLKELLLP